MSQEIGDLLKDDSGRVKPRRLRRPGSLEVMVVAIVILIVKMNNKDRDIDSLERGERDAISIKVLELTRVTLV
jgi:hypothetical protein